MEFLETWTLFFLFNGITIPVDSVIWPFRIFTYISPYRWAQPAIDYLAFIYTAPYADAAPCDASATSASAIGCQSTALDDDGLGFYCPHLPPAGCLGRTGKQLLAGVSQQFPTIFDIGGDVMGYIGICVAVGIVIKFAFLATFVGECRKGEVPKAGGASSGASDRHAI